MLFTHYEFDYDICFTGKKRQNLMIGLYGYIFYDCL